MSKIPSSEPTAQDRTRDLRADLALCHSVAPPPWHVEKGDWQKGEYEDRVVSPCPCCGLIAICPHFGASSHAEFFAACPAGWSAAIRRALAAEAEVESLREVVNELKHGEAHRQYSRLCAAIRKHRDQRGDDRCWKDNHELWAVLPEGYEPPATDTLVELENCEKYIASCHNPATVYVSPQRRIEELEMGLTLLVAALDLDPRTLAHADAVRQAQLVLRK